MKKLKYLMTVALVLVLALLIYYVYVNKDDGGSDDDGNTAISEVGKVLAKDIEGNYPNTAREVVSYFLSIQKCYYNEEYTENELLQLAKQARKLFDEQLINENEFNEYFENLTLEIDEYKSSGKTIVKTILDKAADVVYAEVDGVKYAHMRCVYYLKESEKTTKVVEQYALRCGSDGKWKILGWEIYQPSEYEE